MSNLAQPTQGPYQEPILPSKYQHPHHPGAGIDCFKADVVAGELTLRLTDSGCRYILTAADLYRV